MSAFMRYRDCSGNRVSVLQYDTRGDLPVFDAEVVGRSGDVLDYCDNIVGELALERMIQRKLWERES